MDGGDACKKIASHQVFTPFLGTMESEGFLSLFKATFGVGTTRPGSALT